MSVLAIFGYRRIVAVMNVSLGKLADYVKAKVRSGVYRTDSEVVRDALRRMQAAEEAEAEDVEQFIAEAHAAPRSRMTKADWAILRKLALSGGRQRVPKRAA